MTRKVAVISIVAALALGAACKKDKGKQADKTPATDKDTPTTDQPATDKDTPPPPAAALSAEDRTKKVGEYWSAFNSGGDFKSSYGDGAMIEVVDANMKGPADAVIGGFRGAFPDLKQTNVLTLASATGDKVITVDLMQGTNTGSLMGAPPTKKKIGVVAAHVFDVDDQGKITGETVYLDQGTMGGQLGMHKNPVRPAMDKAPEGAGEVVVGKDGDEEKKNTEWAKAYSDAFNAHDAKKLAGMTADDVVASDQGSPKDMVGAKAAGAWLGMFFAAFPDVKCEAGWSVMAGAYVAQASTCTGTNKGKAKEMGLAKPTNKPVTLNVLDVWQVADGKAKKVWTFYNGMAMAIQLGLMKPPPPPPAGGAAPAGDDKGAAAGDDKGAGDEAAAGGDKKPADKKKGGDKKAPK